MAKVWGARGGETWPGDEHSGRAARDLHQKKELELEGERSLLQKLEGEIRSKKEEFNRLRRKRENLDSERVRLDAENIELERTLADAERRLSGQKARITRLEHEVEQLREARFRGRSIPKKE